MLTENKNKNKNVTKIEAVKVVNAVSAVDVDEKAFSDIDGLLQIIVESYNKAIVIGSKTDNAVEASTVNRLKHLLGKLSGTKAFTSKKLAIIQSRVVKEKEAKVRKAKSLKRKIEALAKNEANIAKLKADLAKAV